MAGVEGEGKGKKQRAKRVSVREGDQNQENNSVLAGRSLLLSSQFSRGRFDPFPPFLRPATQALGRVVRKPVNAINPVLIVNHGSNFSSIKMLSSAYVLCSLRIIMLKTEGQQIQTEHLAEKLQK